MGAPAKPVKLWARRVWTLELSLVRLSSFSYLHCSRFVFRFDELSRNVTPWFFLLFVFRFSYYRHIIYTREPPFPFHILLLALHHDQTFFLINDTLSPRFFLLFHWLSQAIILSQLLCFPSKQIIIFSDTPAQVMSGWHFVITWHVYEGDKKRPESPCHSLKNHVQLDPGFIKRATDGGVDVSWWHHTSVMFSITQVTAFPSLKQIFKRVAESKTYSEKN